MEALQASALPQIQKMMNLNPLSNYAAWSPRQIAGSNPAYESLFQQASQMGPALGGLSYLFGGGTPLSVEGASGGASSGGDGMAVPYMGGYNASGTWTGGTTPTPPPQFQAQNIQDIVNSQVGDAVQQAVATYSQPPRNSVQGTTYYDMYGNPHDLLQIYPYASDFQLQNASTGNYGEPVITANGGSVGIPIAQYFPV